MLTFTGRVGIQQRLLPAYRMAFFDRLAQACLGGLSVFAGEPRADEAILPGGSLAIANAWPARNLHLMSGKAYLCYQRGLTDWLDTWQPDLLVMEANPRYLSSGAGARWMRRRGRGVIGWGLGAPGAAGRGWRRALLARSLRRFEALIAYSQVGAQQYAALGIPRLAHLRGTQRRGARPGRDSSARATCTPDRPACSTWAGWCRRTRRPAVAGVRCLVPRPAGGHRGRRAGRAAGSRHWPGRCARRRSSAGRRPARSLRPLISRQSCLSCRVPAGLALQQAMSSGLPLVSGRGDGTQADLVTPANGWILEREEPAELAAVLHQALADPQRLRRMGGRRPFV